MTVVGIAVWCAWLRCFGSYVVVLVWLWWLLVVSYVVVSAIWSVVLLWYVRVLFECWLSVVCRVGAVSVVV